MQLQKKIDIDVQGHRGARGLFPENTIPAFKHALKLGVNTLELDVVISKDHKLIVSHEPYMSSKICLTPDGMEIPEDQEKSFNIYKMTYEQIKMFDCGSLYISRFPDQIKLRVHKPSLKDMVEEVERLSAEHFYNIEIKRIKGNDLIFHPEYRVFADLLISELTELKVLERTTIQCFDIETLQYINDQYPLIRLVYLIENKEPIEINISNLGFVPFVYSPDYRLIDSSVIEYCKSSSIRLIPWTVNDPNDMHTMILMGVDGIITDYPNILLEYLSKASE